MIENPKKRVINFVFTNPFPVRLNEFSQRLRKYFDNKLESYITEMESRITSYIEKIRNEELDDQEDDPTPYPLTQSPSPYLTLDITSIGRIALTTADDPFFNLPPSHKKYFPELVIYNQSGEIIEIVNESCLGIETKTHSEYEPNCRDSKLKINDDRKISISLLLQKTATMVLLLIKSKDLSSFPDVNSSEFDRAQFRLIDDETNQTIDQSRLKDVKLTVPTLEGEGDEENQKVEAEDEDDEEGNKKKVQNVILMGRIALVGDKWIYERYNYMYKEDQHLDLYNIAGSIEAQARDYRQTKDKLIKEEQRVMIENREAAAQAAAAKAASKKSKKTKPDDKKKKEEKEEEKVEHKIEKQQAPDIHYMPGFQIAIQDVYSTVFGPISFDLKEDKWDTKKAKDLVLKKLKDQLGDKIKD